jgi:hypothetical protein
MQRIITLPLDYARCPTPKRHPCSKSDNCARNLLPEGEPGRPVKDFTFGVTWFAAACHGYINAAAAIPEAQHERRTHPPIGSHFACQEIDGTPVPGFILTADNASCLGGNVRTVSDTTHAPRVGDTHTFRAPTVGDADPLRCEGGARCTGAQTWNIQ